MLVQLSENIGHNHYVFNMTAPNIVEISDTATNSLFQIPLAYMVYLNELVDGTVRFKPFTLSYQTGNDHPL